MKVEVDIKEGDNKIYLIIPEWKSYEGEDSITYIITDVSIKFDENEEEEYNEVEAKKLVDLICDITHMGLDYPQEFKQKYYYWIKKALREKLKLNKEVVSV